MADRGKGTFIGSLWSRARSSSNIFKGMTSGLRRRKPRRAVRPGTTITIEEPKEWPTRTHSRHHQDPEEEDEEELLPRVSDDDVPPHAVPEQPQQERGSSEERRDAPDSPDESVLMTIDVNELPRLH
jgi:hypothetical protein